MYLMAQIILQDGEEYITRKTNQLHLTLVHYLLPVVHYLEV
ncbi:Uncharacterised protein [Escherichia coli]|nr:Uncharacterised protein [Escherichia coli]